MIQVMIAAPGTTIAGDVRERTYERVHEVIRALGVRHHGAETHHGDNRRNKASVHERFTKASTAAPTVVGDPSATCPISCHQDA